MEALNIGSAQDRVEEGVQQSDYFINDPQVHSAYLQQYQIGWRQIYIGRLTKEWNRSLTHNTGDNSEGCLANAIKIIWSYGLQLWQQRNLVYGETGEVSTNTQLSMTKLVNEVQTVLLWEIDYDMRWIVNQKLLTEGTNTYSNIIRMAR